MMRACIDIEDIEDLWYKRLVKTVKTQSCKHKRLLMKNSKTLMQTKYGTKTLSDSNVNSILKQIKDETVIREKIE